MRSGRRGWPVTSHHIMQSHVTSDSDTGHGRKHVPRWPICRASYAGAGAVHDSLECRLLRGYTPAPTAPRPLPRPSIVGMPGSMVTRLRLCNSMSTPLSLAPPPSFPVFILAYNRLQPEASTRRYTTTRAVFDSANTKCYPGT